MKKRTLRRCTAMLMALVLTAASVVSAAASEALGEDLTQVNKEVSQSTVLSTNVFWSTTYSDLRTENVITYSPNSFVTPIVTYGGSITSRSTVSSQARNLEAQGYRVVAGINGDFYNTGNGVPIGLVITDGVVRSSDGGYYAIGFRADGTAVLGKPGLKFSATLGQNTAGETIIRSLAGVNKARVSDGGIYLYDYDFNDRHTTGSTESGVDVVCSVVSGSLSVGGTMTLMVDQVIEATSATSVPQGKYVLSCNNKSNSYYTDALRNLTPGQTISISTTASDSSWNGVQYAVGALYSLVQNGSVVSGLPSGANPRTAIGQKSDGSLVFYTIDGRRSGYSIGATMTQIASRMVELGCVTALCLDGGGSTTLSVTQPDATSAALVNKPSDGSERSVTNHVFLVATAQPTGVLDHLYVSPDNQYVLAGSSVNIAASGVDTNYIPMETADFTLTASAGTISGHTLVTPAAGGDITVTATAGGRTGTAVVHAIPTPDSISISSASGKISSLSVTPGETVALSASAIYNHLALASDAGAFTWTVSGDIGTIDAKGNFTASGTPGASGTITATAGGRSTSITVKVGTLSLQTMESFETSFSERTGNAAALSFNQTGDLVRFGLGSGKLTYDASYTGYATLPLDSAVRSSYTRLNFWVYGDGSGNLLSIQSTALSSDGSTTVTSTTAAVNLNFTGWQQVSVELPKGTTAITGLEIAGTGSGAVYLDQMVLSYGTIIDSAAPSITASLSGTALTATVSDAVDGVLSKAQVTVTYDGKALSFNYDTASGKLTATVPAADGAGHRLTITAADASGNRARKSIDIAASAGHTSAFTDTQGYWAQTYVDFLYTSGITTGYTDGSFRPTQNISRQEFAVMLYRYLGLDGSQYANVTLPFADSAKIGSFAQTAIKALYTEGIINGTKGSDGKLYFNPYSAISRAQAAAMIGRTQPKGYAAPALTFTDAASIPSYASFYISTLSAQGVISGYTDGSFKPNDSISRGQMAKILYNLM